MNAGKSPGLDDSVAALLGRWPFTADVFRRTGLADCLGCVMAPHESLAEACAAYGVDAQHVLEELRLAVVQEKRHAP